MADSEAPNALGRGKLRFSRRTIEVRTPRGNHARRVGFLAGKGGGGKDENEGGVEGFTCWSDAVNQLTHEEGLAITSGEEDEMVFIPTLNLIENMPSKAR